MKVSLQFLIDISKRGDDIPRWFTVQQPLPDDVLLGGISAQPWADTVALLLESAEWEGDTGTVTPVFTTVWQHAQAAEIGGET